MVTQLSGTEPVNEWQTFLTGQKLYQQRARMVLPVLVRQAKAEERVTYGQLAEELGIPNARTLNHVLDMVGRALIDLGRQWQTTIPSINSLVVKQDTRLPGSGFEGFAPDPKLFRSGTKREREKMIEGLCADIYRYKRWDDVLAASNLEPAKPPVLSQPAASVAYGRGGGESEQHKALKAYVAQHPELLGLKRSMGRGKVEYRFLSGDEIDVLFFTSAEWVGAEVKAGECDDAEIQRGLFQCVKYRALIEAHQKTEQRALGGVVILVLGGAFPDCLNPLRNTLGIEVVSNVVVPESARAGV